MKARSSSSRLGAGSTLFMWSEASPEECGTCVTNPAVDKPRHVSCPLPGLALVIGRGRTVRSRRPDELFCRHRSPTFLAHPLEARGGHQSLWLSTVPHAVSSRVSLSSPTFLLLDLHRPTALDHCRSSRFWGSGSRCCQRAALEAGGNGIRVQLAQPLGQIVGQSAPDGHSISAGHVDSLRRDPKRDDIR